MVLLIFISKIKINLKIFFRIYDLYKSNFCVMYIYNLPITKLNLMHLMFTSINQL